MNNKHASEHFGKKIIISDDIKSYHHTLAFVVARLAHQDMLAKIKGAIQKAIDDGASFAVFKKRLYDDFVKLGFGKKPIAA